MHIPTLRLRNTELIRGMYVDVSIEQVAALSSQNTLPEPTLDLDRLQPSTSSFMPTPYRQNTAQTIRPAGPAYSDDPWSTNKYPALPANPPFGSGTGFNPAPPAPPPISAVSSVQGTGLPDFWWKRQETVRVTLLGQQGFILNRYVVYEIATEVSASVPLGQHKDSGLILHSFAYRGAIRSFDVIQSFPSCGIAYSEDIRLGCSLLCRLNE